MKRIPLTTVPFIRAITTVVFTVTHPYFRDAPAIITGKVAVGAGGGEFGGTVHFIRIIAAVVHAITAPPGVDAAPVVAGECLWRARRSWKR